VIDEAEAVSSGIWKSCANLYRYPIDSGGEFCLIAPANPRSRLSYYGRFIEPLDGWNTVSVDTDEWVGKPQLDGSNSHIIRFDFRKSPNVTNEKPVSKHLPSRATVTARLNSLKTRGAENDPDHWCYDLGFPPPDGMLKTPFTETMLLKAEAFAQQQFSGSEFRIIGACDPAYTGDRPVVQFAAFGYLMNGLMGYEALDPIVLSTDAASTNPVRYQLLEQIRHHCSEIRWRGRTYECKPEHFGIDCTGDAGLADIAQREWAQEIHRIVFSASASEMQCSQEDMRPAKEVYANVRAEMYYQTRDAVEAGQIKGVPKDTAAELCSILEIVERTDGSVRPRKTLETKKEYKKRNQKSPDLADGFVMLFKVAQSLGMNVGAVGLTKEAGSGIDALVKMTNEVYEEPEQYYQSAYDDDPVENYV